MVGILCVVYFLTFAVQSLCTTNVLLIRCIKIVSADNTVLGIE